MEEPKTKKQKQAQPKKRRSADAISRQWIRRAARIAKSSGLEELAVWTLKDQTGNAIRFKKELATIRARVAARKS